MLPRPHVVEGGLQPLVEVAVLEGHRGLVRERARERDVLAGPAPSGPVPRHHRADHAPLHEQRQRERGAMVARGHFLPRGRAQDRAWVLEQVRGGSRLAGGGRDAFEAGSARQDRVRDERRAPDRRRGRHPHQVPRLRVEPVDRRGARLEQAGHPVGDLASQLGEGQRLRHAAGDDREALGDVAAPLGLGEELGVAQRQRGLVAEDREQVLLLAGVHALRIAAHQERAEHAVAMNDEVDVHSRMPPRATSITAKSTRGFCSTMRAERGPGRVGLDRRAARR